MTLFSYLTWHYTAGLQSVITESTRLVNGLANHFSINYLLLTLFYPWHRYIEPYKSGFYISEFVWSLSQNLISRILGAIVRLATIITGGLITITTMILGLFFIGSWIATPILIPIFFVWGLRLLL